MKLSCRLKLMLKLMNQTAVIKVLRILPSILQCVFCFVRLAHACEMFIGRLSLQGHEIQVVDCDFLVKTEWADLSGLLSLMLLPASHLSMEDCQLVCANNWNILLGAITLIRTTSEPQVLLVLDFSFFRVGIFFMYLHNMRSNLKWI